MFVIHMYKIEFFNFNFFKMIQKDFCIVFWWAKLCYLPNYFVSKYEVCLILWHDLLSLVVARPFGSDLLDNFLAVLISQITYNSESINEKLFLLIINLNLMYVSIRNLRNQELTSLYRPSLDSAQELLNMLV